MYFLFNATDFDLLILVVVQLVVAELVVLASADYFQELPQTAAPAEVSHAIFMTKPGAAVFYLDGDNGRRGRLVIRT